MKSLSIFLLLTTIALISCGDDDPPTGNENPNDTTETNDTIEMGLGMTVNGESWVPITVNFNDPDFPGAVIKEITAIQGTSVTTGQSLTIGLTSLDVGTYPVTTDGSGVTINFVADSDPGTSFTADPVEISSGTVEIVENSQTEIAGRFSFSGTSQGGTSYAITDGTFRVVK